MQTDELLMDLEKQAAERFAEGHKALYFYLVKGVVTCSVGRAMYLYPGFICRLNARQCKSGLTWRQRQKIGWRLEELVTGKESAQEQKDETKLL